MVALLGGCILCDRFVHLVLLLIGITNAMSFSLIPFSYLGIKLTSTMPLAATSPLMLLIWIFVDRRCNRSISAMWLVMRFTCEPGSQRQRIANVFPNLPMASATMVANSANALGLALGVPSHSVMLCKAFTDGLEPPLLEAWLFGGASHNKLLCLTLHKSQGRSVHLSTERCIHVSSNCGIVPKLAPSPFAWPLGN